MDGVAPSAPTQREEAWLQRTGLTSDTAARMAYALIAGSNKFVESEQEFLENQSLFFRLWMHQPETPEGVENPILTWRFPGTDLGLLQLAVVCDNDFAAGHLASDDVSPALDEDLGENHPLHLACALGRISVVVELKTFYRGFLMKKGSVSVGVNPSLTPEAPAAYMDTPLHGSCLELALQNKHASLALHLVPDYFKMLEGTNVVPAIEYLWLVLDHMPENGQPDELCLCPLLTYSGQNREVHDNLFLLCCHLLNTHSLKAISWPYMTDSKILKAMVREAIGNKRQDLLSRAARHCTQAQLHMVITFVEGAAHLADLPFISCPHHLHLTNANDSAEKAAALRAFREEKAGRTLQQEAALTILRSVGGDARRAKTLSDLPEPLLDMFTVPFQDLHQRLTGSTQ